MNENKIFKLKPLPYSYDALEPYIDAKTMEIHHSKHHQAYVNNLNKGLEAFPQYQDKTLIELLKDIETLPEKLKITLQRHGGGTFNHEIFFDGMSLNNPFPEGKLKQAIDKEFGSLEKFKEEFKNASLSVFGSGWTWLVKDKENKLSIIQTANQLSPISLGLQPVLALDVWEHAYYLKFQNRRAEYIENWFHVIDWEKALENFIN